MSNIFLGWRQGQRCRRMDILGCRRTFQCDTDRRMFLWQSDISRQALVRRRWRRRRPRRRWGWRGTTSLRSPGTFWEGLGWLWAQGLFILRWWHRTIMRWWWRTRTRGHRARRPGRAVVVPSSWTFTITAVVAVVSSTPSIPVRPTHGIAGLSTPMIVWTIVTI